MRALAARELVGGGKGGQQSWIFTVYTCYMLVLGTTSSFIEDEALALLKVIQRRTSHLSFIAVYLISFQGGRESDGICNESSQLTGPTCPAPRERRSPPQPKPSFIEEKQLDSRSVGHCIPPGG